MGHWWSLQLGLGQSELRAGTTAFLERTFLLRLFPLHAPPRLGRLCPISVSVPVQGQQVSGEVSVLCSELSTLSVFTLIP